MKGKIYLQMYDGKEKVGETITDFHFRLRDVDSFYITDNDDIVISILRIERVFVYDEDLIKILEQELSGLK